MTPPRDSMPPFDLLLSVTPLGRALGKLGWIPLGSVPVTLCVPAWESWGTGAASPARTPRFCPAAPWTGLGLAVISQGSRARPWSCLIPSELDMDTGRGDEGNTHHQSLHQPLPSRDGLSALWDSRDCRDRLLSVLLGVLAAPHPQTTHSLGNLLPHPPPPGRQSGLLAAEWHPGTAGDTWAEGAGQAALLTVISG